MKSLVFAGIATTALIVASAPVSASDSFAPASPQAVGDQLEITANSTRSGGMRMHHGTKPRMNMHRSKKPHVNMRHRAKPHVNMRHGTKPHVNMRHGTKPHVNMRHGTKPHVNMRHGTKPHMNRHGRHDPRIIRGGGNRGSGFVGFYRQPFYGFSLPSYWIAPSFGISNYNSFGLSAPQRGYSWSRYYDDAVLRDNRGMVYDYRQNIDWSRGGAGYAPNGYYSQQQPQNGPAIRADSDVYGWGEETYGSPAPVGTTERGVYDGAWTGQYIDPERRTYRGQWDGTYTNDQGQVYQGTYRGTSTGDPVFRQGTGGAATRGAPYPVSNASPYPAGPPPVAQGYPVRPAQVSQHRPRGGGYGVPNGYGRYERCLKGRGLAGGAIGAILGGFAGNRIAGRGNRLAGSLIGGGIGALAGVGIEKATRKCKKYLPRREYRRPVAHRYPQQYPQPQPLSYYPQQPQSYGWIPGYYYPPQQQAAVTTITIIPGTATTTTTTTEEVFYETVYTKARPRKGKGLRRPARTSKRCNC